MNLGYPPPQPPPTSRALDRYANSMVDREIGILKDQYIHDQITLDELEDRIGNWLKWEQLSPIDRLEFERQIDDIRWKASQISKDTGKVVRG